MNSNAVLAWEESFSKPLRGLPVSLGGLGVDAEVEPGIGVPEPGLGRLEVDTFQDESGGVGPRRSWHWAHSTPACLRAGYQIRWSQFE